MFRQLRAFAIVGLLYCSAVTLSFAQEDVLDTSRQLDGAFEQFGEQVRACWFIPLEARDSQLEFDLLVSFTPDGLVDGQPEIIDQNRYTNDPIFRIAADTAVAAVLDCQFGYYADETRREGYALPRDQHEEWRTVRLSFDMRWSNRWPP